ncbi:MAG TPA: heptaprenyl diphosphate synthase [Lachnospiraceae bacterium]|nr:heptaprenyl diphosphate synthase [Lachnospiraceae bacterium]
MSKKVAYYGIFAALSVLMGYVEAMIPVPLPIPGIKLGLSNVIVLLALYVMGTKEAFFISVIRVFISALLFRGFLGFWYSVAGAFLSYGIMVLAKKSGKMSIIGVSVLGGIFHNLGQIVVACLIIGRTVVFYLVPVLMVSGVVTGFAIGIVAGYCTQYMQNRI